MNMQAKERKTRYYVRQKKNNCYFLFGATISSEQMYASIGENHHKICISEQKEKDPNACLSAQNTKRRSQL